jgi:hypothetical protein
MVGTTVAMLAETMVASSAGTMAALWAAPKAVLSANCSADWRVQHWAVMMAAPKAGL